VLVQTTRSSAAEQEADRTINAANVSAVRVIHFIGHPHATGNRSAT